MSNNYYGNGNQYGQVSPIKRLASQEDLFEAANYIGSQLSNNTQVMANTVQGLAKYAERLSKKDRKKLCNRTMAFYENGEIIEVDTFDDGTSKNRRMCENIRGPYSICCVRFKDVEPEKKYFWICFEPTKHNIFGDREKLSERYLYNAFIESGVKFSLETSKAVAGKLLYETFAPKIAQTQMSIINSGLAGWHAGVFQSKENCEFAKFDLFSRLPVMQKTFNYMLQTSEEENQIYFEALRKITDLRERTLITTFPFLGMLVSIFQEEGRTIPFFLNIRDSGFTWKTKIICNLMQVFNRENLMPIPFCDMSKNEQNAVLFTSKDEIFIVSAIISDCNSPYEKNKRREQLRTLSHMITKGCALPGNIRKPAQVGLVLISDIYLPEENVFNLFLEGINEECRQLFKQMMDYKVMEKIFSTFVCYVETHMEDIFREIHNVNIGDEKIETLSIIYHILCRFWESKGICMDEALGIKETDIFNMVKADDYDENNELIKIFVQSIREFAPTLHFRRKSNGELDENSIIYNEDFYWFPSSIILKVLDLYSLSVYKNQILAQLKEDGSLITDKEGLSRKLQIGGKRSEYYQFSKGVFNSIGMVELQELGGENDA